MCLGLVMFLAGKIMLTKKYIYHHDLPNEIRLDSPAYSDYLYTFGIIFLLFGCITFQPLLDFFADAVFEPFHHKTTENSIPVSRSEKRRSLETSVYMAMGFMVVLIIILLTIMRMISRLKNAVHDKIVIGANTIFLDDPNGDSSLVIDRKSIKQIKYLKTFNDTSKKGEEKYSPSNYSLELMIRFSASQGKDSVTIDSKGMNIKLDYVIEALQEMNYEVELFSCLESGKSEWEGHDLI